MLGEQYYNQRAVIVMKALDGEPLESDPMDRWLAEWLLVNIISVTAEFDGKRVAYAHIENRPRQTEIRDVQVPLR